METTEDVLSIYSNLKVFYEIAKDSFELSFSTLEKNRTPKENGGYILSFDPTRTSLKQGLISIAFAGSYIDLHLRLFYIINKGVWPSKKWDRYQSYKQKLENLGVYNPEFLKRVEELSEIRHSVAHESPIVIGIAGPDSNSGTAQQGAQLGMHVINEIRERLPLTFVRKEND